MKDLECPVNHEIEEQALDWLLGYAIRLEYSEKGSNYIHHPIYICAIIGAFSVRCATFYLTSSFILVKFTWEITANELTWEIPA